MASVFLINDREHLPTQRRAQRKGPEFGEGAGAFDDNDHEVSQRGEVFLHLQRVALAEAGNDLPYALRVEDIQIWRVSIEVISKGVAALASIPPAEKNYWVEAAKTIFRRPKVLN